MEYSLLILGVFRDGKVDHGVSRCCFEAITSFIYEEFCKLPHVTIAVRDVYTDILDRNKHDGDGRCDVKTGQVELPRCDAILYVDWNNSDKINFDEIKKITGAKVVMSFLEVPVFGMDWCFIFRESGLSNTTTFHAPCKKDIYNRIPKKKKIVIDHGWEYTKEGIPTNWNWSERISDWAIGWRSSS